MNGKRLKLLGLLIALLLVVAVVPGASAQDATLEEEIEASVVAGLDWLADQQNADGSFGTYELIGHTGLAVLKFEDRALDLKLDPLGDDYEYAPVVRAGLDYIVASHHTMPLGPDPEPAGDPDGDGDGVGVYWDGWHPIYSTGIALMALSASQHPELYGDLAQDAVDYLAWAQVDPDCGVHRGGWRYAPDECNSDNSNSGYVTLGLGYAAAPPPFGFGIEVPQFVKDELSVWIDVIQDPVDGDPDDGGSWYDPYFPWVNILKTGNLLHEMGLVGDVAATPRVQDAVDYIERHWSDPGAGGTGWLDHRQAMFTMMKGLDSLGIELLDLDDDGVAEHEWFVEVATHLIDTQNPDGSWPWDPWGDSMLSTAWALLTLERAVPKFEVPVAFDVHPTSCRNPLNVSKKGVTPAAILGTAEFDVAHMDPASLQLEGVSPLRWSYEDVATPYEPYLGKVDAYDCTTDGPDGYMDLTLKFDTPELVAALGDVSDGDVLVVTITGNLMEEYGGTPIVGEDVIVILKKK